jgi:3-phosphoshikimate 1-carboxyvinyltransferase
VRGKPRVPGGGNVITRLDPKLAMAFLVLGMAADQPVTIDDGAAMQDLFPGFAEAFEHVGASFSEGSAA